MAASAVIACPECKKKFKGRDDLEGKKIRCPACNHPFVAHLGAAEKPASGPAGSQPKSQGKPTWEAEDDDPNPYGVTELDVAPRCPHCANLLESEDAVICLYCGYNTLTRQLGYTKKTYAKTGSEHFVWLLPGLACLLGIIVIMNLDIFFCLLLPDIVRGESGWKLLDHESMRLWTVVISLSGIWALGFFCYKRLILEPVPPEKEKD
jgi:DNA-directed RNA polymerase subunit RPC12/RpoP